MADRSVARLSSFLQSYGIVLVVVAAIAFALLRERAQTSSGRRWLDAVRLKLPVAGTIFRHFAVARFCRVLGTLLKNDVPILKSLEISRDAAGNMVLSQAIADASANITSGQSLAKPLAASKQFPLTVVEMIAVAEESNTLDRVLVDLAIVLRSEPFANLIWVYDCWNRLCCSCCIDRTVRRSGLVAPDHQNEQHYLIP